MRRSPGDRRQSALRGALRTCAFSRCYWLWGVEADCRGAAPESFRRLESLVWQCRRESSRSTSCQVDSGRLVLPPREYPPRASCLGLRLAAAPGGCWKQGGGTVLTGSPRGRLIGAHVEGGPCLGWRSKAGHCVSTRMCHKEYGAAGHRALGLSRGSALATECRRDRQGSGINPVDRSRLGPIHIPRNWPCPRACLDVPLEADLVVCARGNQPCARGTPPARGLSVWTLTAEAACSRAADFPSPRWGFNPRGPSGVTPANVHRRHLLRLRAPSTRPRRPPPHRPRALSRGWRPAARSSTVRNRARGRPPRVLDVFA